MLKPNNKNSEILFIYNYRCLIGENWSILFTHTHKYTHTHPLRYHNLIMNQSSQSEETLRYNWLSLLASGDQLLYTFTHELSSIFYMLCCKDLSFYQLAFKNEGNEIL